MTTVVEALQEVRSVSGKIDKANLLQEHKDVTGMQLAVRLALDPNIKFRMKRIQVPVGLELRGEIDICEALERLLPVHTRHYVGNAAYDYVMDLMQSLTTMEEVDLFHRIVTQDLDCGFSASTINKVWDKKFFIEPPYMRCSSLSKKSVAKIKDGVIEMKMDGQYLNMKVTNGDFSPESRSGTVYNFFGKPDEQFRQIEMYVRSRFMEKYPELSSGIVLNGEAVVHDENGIRLPRQISNGIVGTYGEDKNTGLESDVDTIHYYVWDILPFSSFEQRIWNVSRRERREILLEALAELNCPNIHFVEHHKVTSLEEAIQITVGWMKNGEEGGVYKDESGIWKHGTSAYQVKIKTVFECDLRVIGKTEGKGARKATLGSLICASEDGIVEVGVSGFTDAQLKDMAANFETKYLNTIYTVAGNNVTEPSDSNSKYSIYLPRAIEHRTDKTVADSFDRVMEQLRSAHDVLSIIEAMK